MIRFPHETLSELYSIHRDLNRIDILLAEMRSMESEDSIAPHFHIVQESVETACENMLDAIDDFILGYTKLK